MTQKDPLTKVSGVINASYSELLKYGLGYLAVRFGQGNCYNRRSN